MTTAPVPVTGASRPGIAPLDLMASLVLEDGRAWGEAAHPWQRDDAAAVLDNRPDAARLHFLTRPRGGSKTTDLAAAALAVLLTQAPPRSTSHAYARDKDQAALLVAALSALAHRSGLAGLLDLGPWGVVVRSTGARLVVESADAASAFGHIPFLVIVDELAQWPTTRGARTLWEAIVSGLPKRRDSRLVVLTTAGDPAHWSAAVIAAARTSPRWRVSEVPGPLPWADADDLAEQRRLLPASSYARLHLNQWTAAEDRLTDPDDLAACVTHSGPLDPDPRNRYVIGLDLGLKSDRTVLTVCHAEPRPEAPSAPPRVVLDRIHVLAGTRDNPVQLADVEAATYEAARAYAAPVRVDPWQAVGLAQRLRSRTVNVQEWTFTPASVGRLAMTLHLLLREHRLALPDDPELLDELANVRLRETTPGVFRLDHDAGHHDDRAVSLGLAALALTERAPVGLGSITNPATLGQRIERGTPGRPSPMRPSLAASPRALRGLRGAPIVARDSANDPRRWERP